MGDISKLSQSLTSGVYCMEEALPSVLIIINGKTEAVTLPYTVSEWCDVVL